MRKDVKGFVVFDQKKGIGYECKDGLPYGHAVYLVRSNLNMVDKIDKNVKDEIATVYRAKSENDLKVGGEAFLKFLQNKNLDYHDVGILDGNTIKAHLIRADEKNMCYEAINYKATRNLKAKSGVSATKGKAEEDKKYYNPNLVKIKDINFYKQMVETYKELGTLPLKEPEKFKDAPIVEEFIRFYGEASRGLTNEQADDFVNFVEVIAEYNLEDEAYNLPQKFYDYLDKAKELKDAVYMNNSTENEDIGHGNAKRSRDERN